MLQITGLYTAILSLIMLFLAYTVISGRAKHKINLGTGNNSDMEGRVRALGNFTEYVPMLILLMVMGEVQGLSGSYLHGFGMVTILARVLHAMGMLDVMPILKGRYYGTVLTFLLLAVGGGWLLYHSVISML